MIDIIKFLIEKAKTDGMAPFKKFVKTLDNTKIILTGENYDSDDFDEKKAYGTREEKVIVNKELQNKSKRQQWKNKGPKQGQGQEEKKEPYGNSYGRKG
jgi:hypothetical protein